MWGRVGRYLGQVSADVSEEDFEWLKKSLAEGLTNRKLVARRRFLGREKSSISWFYFWTTSRINSFAKEIHRGTEKDNIRRIVENDFNDATKQKTIELVVGETVRKEYFSLWKLFLQKSLTALLVGILLWIVLCVTYISRKYFWGRPTSDGWLEELRSFWPFSLWL
jgi:hypothetical protein